MALIKNKTIKGVNYPYHKIVDCNVKTGFVGVASYPDKETAKLRENMSPEGRIAYTVDFPVEEINPLAYAYEKIKVSNMQPNGEQDEEGNEILVEANFLADAEDEI